MRKTSRGPRDACTLSSLLPRSGLSGRAMRASSGRERRKAEHDTHLPNGQPGPKRAKLTAIMLHTMAHPIDTGRMNHMNTCMACHTPASYVHVCSPTAGPSNQDSRRHRNAATAKQRQQQR